MSEITVNANNQFSETIGARSVFIDDIELDKPIILEFSFSNGEKERHSIVAGSKFSSDKYTIDDITFFNENSVSVDIDYHFSNYLIYDEAKVIGDVKSLVRFDNLTVDGDQFFGGYLHGAVAGQYSFVGIANPLGSGVTVYVRDLMLASPQGSTVLSQHDDVTSMSPVALDFAGGKQLFGGNAMKAKFYYYNQAGGTLTGQSALTDFLGYVPTDTAGTPAQIKLGNAPFALGEGEMLIVRPGGLNASVLLSANWSEE